MIGRRKDIMKNCSHNICKSIRDLVNNCLSEIEVSEEVKKHLENCLACIFLSEENMNLKRIVRESVERTFVPPDLADRIAKEIQKS